MPTHCGRVGPSREMNGQRTSGTATVMFTDVEASTDITTRLGDDAAAALLAAHDTVVLEQVSAYGGRDVRSTGDGFLVVFDSARAGVSCALSIQRELADREPAIRVRIGLNAGEVLEGGGEPFGAAINLAARVMDRADGGEILTTDTVRQLVGTLTDASFRDRGRVALKGFEERQRLYEVRPADGSSAQRPAPRPPPHRLSRRARTLLGTLIVAGAAAIAVAVAVGRGGAPPVSVPANSVAVIDPRAGSVLAAIRVGENPGPVSAGARGVWVLNLDSASVSRIDVGTRRVVETRGFGGTPGTGGTPGNVSASRSEVWVHGGGCNGDTPGVLLHAFTGGADLRGDDDQALAGVLHPHSTPAGSVGGCALVAGGRSAWLGLNG